MAQIRLVIVGKRKSSTRESCNLVVKEQFKCFALGTIRLLNLMLLQLADYHFEVLQHRLKEEYGVETKLEVPFNVVVG